MWRTIFAVLVAALILFDLVQSLREFSFSG